MAKKTVTPPPSSAKDGGAPSPTLSSFPFPSSPSSSSSSSSSDFEFTVSLSPTSRSSSSNLCPADDLFYKGQLLPLHLSPRLSMVRTLILSSSSSSSSTTTTTSASRDSSGSSADSTASYSGDLLLLSAPDYDSSRPSSAAEDDTTKLARPRPHSKYLSSLATKFSSVFHRTKKENTHELNTNTTANNSNNNSGVKEVLKKCVKKVKPLYERLSSLQHHHHHKKTFSFSIRRDQKASCASQTQIISSSSAESKPEPNSVSQNGKSDHSSREIYTHSFSGNLRYPRGNRCAMAASCPSSTRSSPSHSALLVGMNQTAANPHNHSGSSSASMDDLQSAIQGAIAHCKGTMKKETPVSDQI